MDENIYKQNILDHSKHPHNKGKLSTYTFQQMGKNLSCGDSIYIYFNIDEKGVIQDVSFEGEGCAISTAAASMLTDKIKGMSIRDIKAMTPGDVYTMLGISISPARSKCALLAYGTVVEAVKKYEEGN